ncbi:MAG: hypothetical protein LUE86_14035 [Clostridiales bacterium]|nr:hypothetical protein [Clostridiales bacterium]
MIQPAAIGSGFFVGNIVASRAIRRYNIGMRGDGIMTGKFRLGPVALSYTQGSAVGMQPKYYENGYWYKQDRLGYEGLSEYLVSKVLQFSNVRNYARYEKCMVGGKSGCRSRHFLKPEESMISFQRLYEMYEGGQLSERIMTMNSVQDRVDFVKDFILDKTGVDCSKYLSQILTLDMLTLNTDRHFNNLGIIVNTEWDVCRPCVIFDNGRSLMSEWEVFDPENTIKENLIHAYARPFSSNFEAQAAVCGVGLSIDYDRLSVALSKEPPSRALSVLQYQLGRYRDIIPDLSLERIRSSRDERER